MRSWCRSENMHRPGCLLGLLGNLSSSTNATVSCFMEASCGQARSTNAAHSVNRSFQTQLLLSFRDRPPEHWVLCQMGRACCPESLPRARPKHPSEDSTTDMRVFWLRLDDLQLAGCIPALASRDSRATVRKEAELCVRMRPVQVNA